MDILRENIGLLQLDNEYYYDEEPINEFSLFGKKKSRWQRFKDAISRNEGGGNNHTFNLNINKTVKQDKGLPLGKIAAGAALIGAGIYGKKNYRNYLKLKNKKFKNLKYEQDEMGNWHRINPDNTIDTISGTWIPFRSYGKDDDRIMAYRYTHQPDNVLIDYHNGWV